jgi:nucleotide-binding universal stress UspA family protein
VRWAVEQARRTGAHVRAVMAWQIPTTYGWAPVITVDWAGDARTALNSAVDSALKETGYLDVDREVTEGHPAAVLLPAARDADLLVVGCRGHGGFTGMLLGSVSQHVVAHARCPVVVTHDAA